MYVQTGKTFITTLIAVVLALGGLAMLSSGSRKNETSTLAQTGSNAPSSNSQSSSYDSTATNSSTSGQASYEEGYRAGYRDGHQDCSSVESTSAGQSTYSARPTSYARSYTPRTRVASARYYAYSQPRKTHSTRNMILRIAAPAAIGAGIGGIAKGGKGAGIGALLGGGGGALYHLIRHSRD
jgi:hypothetical protein